MIYYLASGVYATCSGTRIFTFLVYASFILGTFRTDHAFRSARWRSTNIFGLARAYCVIIYVFAQTVRAARWRNARVFLGFFNNHLNCKVINKVYVKVTNWLVLLGCGRWQEVNGFPVYPGRQAQVGAWLGTVHSALMPQVPGQGSLHLLLTQALFLGQSEFVTHSGLHPV